MPKSKKTKQSKKLRTEAAPAKQEQRKEYEATMAAWPLLKDFGEGDTRATAVQQVQDALRNAVAARGISFTPDSDAEDDEDTARERGSAIGGSPTPDPEGSDGVPVFYVPRRIRRPRSRFVESDLDEPDYTPVVARVELAKRVDSKPSVREKVRLSLRRLIKYGDFPQSSIDELADSLHKYERGDRLRQQDYDIIMTAAPAPDDSAASVPGGIIRIPRPPRRPPRIILTRPEHASVEASLRADILDIGGRGFATGPFLRGLGNLATMLQRDIHIHGKPLFHATRAAKLGGTMAKSGQFKDYGSAAAFWKARPNNCEISMALAVPWMTPPAGTTWKDFRDSDFHAVLFALLVGDVNASVEEHEDLLPRIKTLLVDAPTHRFLNLARNEPNVRGVCLTLALEWMLELVIGGLEYERREDGKVGHVTGFRPYL
ncbi:hypothetical protein B0H19DRAFT_1182507 [Mycena capillaripes]|nr:hypothetical protein B0H19DRAFT_1182507 [Mycena capillaripes]